jgi:hypothetical protein
VGVEGPRARQAHGRDHGGAGHTGAPLFLLPRLSHGSLPLDDALGLVVVCKQLDMQHAAAQLVTEVSYDTAQSLFGALTGRHFGGERMHTVTNQVAEGLTVPFSATA